MPDFPETFIIAYLTHIEPFTAVYSSCKGLLKILRKLRYPLWTPTHIHRGSLLVFPSPCRFQEKDVQLPFHYMKITHKKQGWIVKQQTGALRLRIKVKGERSASLKTHETS